MPDVPVLYLGDYLSAPADAGLAATAYASLDRADLARWLAHWPDLHAKALAQVEYRVHPSARIHPTAILGADVIVGPGAHVWEFTTVRGHTVIGPGASVGFNCEVTNAYIGAHSVLGHRIGINRTLLGDGVHLSANVTVAAIHLTRDMTQPDRETVLRLPDGLYRCGTPRFGALIGDHTQTGMNITIGPGTAIGRHCQINSHTAIGPTHVIPDHHILSPTEPPAHRARPRRETRTPGPSAIQN
ncbi:transferase [Streptomyces sp. NPDC093586]|uniref:transferase n=1 Tax=Streptomyces sp. NPDC093586 TaxID=3366042 RepID=UPI0037F6EB7A